MRSARDVFDILHATPALTAVRALAARDGVPVRLIGGAVRDVFLGLRPTHFHFVVDGDAGAFASRLAESVSGGRLTAEEGLDAVWYHGRELGSMRFGSANGVRLEDYLRRHADFTVNTLVLDVLDDRIRDPLGSLGDLESETIRSVPPVDFGDRPAYLPLRAVRLALLTPSCVLEAATCAAIAAQGRRVAGADASEAGYELHAILQSPEPGRGLRLLSDLGLLQHVFTAFLPFAAPGPLPDHSGGHRADVDAAIRLLSRLDVVSAPHQPLVSRHLPAMRQAILVTTAMRATGLNVAGEEGRRFLIAHGDYIERVCNALSGRFSSVGIHAFRVRMLLVGYWRGLTAMADGAAPIEQAIEGACCTLGSHKGFLAGLLIGADVLFDHDDASPQTERVASTLGRLAAEYGSAESASRGHQPAGCTRASGEAE